MRRGATWQLLRVAALTVLAAAIVEGFTTRPTLSARFEIAPVGESEATRRIQRATIEAFAFGCDLALRQGTAVAFATDQVFTNEHVVGAFRSIDLAADGRPVIAASTVRVGTGGDVVIVRAGGLGIEPLALAPFDPPPGEPVLLAGYPHAASPEATPGGLLVVAGKVVDFVSGRQMGQPGQVMRVDVPVQPGMSGGPVLDQAGRLAGILFAVQSPTNDALVIPASVLRTLLDRPTSTEPAGCGG